MSINFKFPLYSTVTGKVPGTNTVGLQRERLQYSYKFLPVDSTVRRTILYLKNIKLIGGDFRQAG